VVVLARSKDTRYITTMGLILVTTYKSSMQQFLNGFTHACVHVYEYHTAVHRKKKLIWSRALYFNLFLCSSKGDWEEDKRGIYAFHAKYAWSRPQCARTISLPEETPWRQAVVAGYTAADNDFWMKLSSVVVWIFNQGWPLRMHENKL
jgi:hypothetical protein